MTAGSFSTLKSAQMTNAKRTGLVPAMLAAMAAFLPFNRTPPKPKPEPKYDASGKRRPKLNLGAVSKTYLRTIQVRPEIYGKRHNRRWRHKPCPENFFLAPF